VDITCAASKKKFINRRKPGGGLGKNYGGKVYMSQHKGRGKKVTRWGILKKITSGKNGRGKGRNRGRLSEEGRRKNFKGSTG